MAKLERQIQAEIVKDLKASGYLVSTHPAPIGWPDIRAFRNGKAVLIEVKRPGQKPNRLQEITIEKFKNQGFDVFVLTDRSELHKLNIL